MNLLIHIYLKKIADFLKDNYSHFLKNFLPDKVNLCLFGIRRRFDLNNRYIFDPKIALRHPYIQMPYALWLMPLQFLYYNIQKQSHYTYPSKKLNFPLQHLDENKTRHKETFFSNI